MMKVLLNKLSDSPMARDKRKLCRGRLKNQPVISHIDLMMIEIESPLTASTLTFKRQSDQPTHTIHLFDHRPTYNSFMGELIHLIQYSGFGEERKEASKPFPDAFAFV